MVSPAASAGRLGSALPFLLVLLDLQYQGEPRRGPWWGCGAGGTVPRPVGAGPRPWWLVAGRPPSVRPSRRGCAVSAMAAGRTLHTPPASSGPCRLERGAHFGKGCAERDAALPPHHSALWQRMSNKGTGAAGDLLGLVRWEAARCVCFALPGLLTDGLGLPPATVKPRVPWCPRVQLWDSIGPSVLAVNFALPCGFCVVPKFKGFSSGPSQPQPVLVPHLQIR